MVGSSRRIQVIPIVDPRPKKFHCAGLWVVAALVLVIFGSSSTVGAQYGGVSGLFVTTSVTNPGYADFAGLGCEGGVEVVLYLPGTQPTATDPSATQSVPGRILAVTTSVTSPNSVEDGTFAFASVELPRDLDPGVYQVQSRCGDLDLEVLIQLTSQGTVTLAPTRDSPILNDVPEALPFTGRSSNRIVSTAAGFVALGVSLSAWSRRSSQTSRS